MDTLKFGLNFWKRNIPLSIVSQILSFISIIADLMFPMLTGILLNYIIKGLPAAWDVSVFSDAFTFALLIVILLFKPTGLFGEKISEKV